MATISSPGIGSGLDVNSIITQLMAIESQPLTNLQTAATTINTQISEVGKVTSAISALGDLALKMSASDFWSATTAASSSSEVSVTSDSTAVAGNYAVEVQQLASAQSLVGSQTFASSTAAVGSGTMTLELGTWNTGQTSFTSRSPAASTSITVDATDTVQSLRDKINTSNAGVTASILTDASGARLMLRSKATGEVNGFRIGVAGGTGALGSLAFDPSAGVTGGATQTTAAANAKATINGVAVSSTTNTVTNVLEGLSLTLNAKTTAPLNVGVSSNSASITKTLQDFATAYTNLNKLIATDTKYDPTTKKGGPLQGDSSITSLQTRLRSLIGSSSNASTAFPRLSDAGFEIQQDGSLTVNSTKLSNALSNLPQLQSMFANNTPTDQTTQGFARKLRSMTDDLLGIGGTLTSRSDGLNAKLQRNQKDQDAMNVRLADTQARLQAQYTALDTQLGTLNGLSTYMTQQVAQWNKA